jgi:hypothetical protein
VVIAALVCLRLGWWQWNVAHETRGTIQNLGYALLWPVFGGAFIFMWLRFLYLEQERRVQPIDPAVPTADAGPDAATDPGGVRAADHGAAGPGATGPGAIGGGVGEPGDVEPVTAETGAVGPDVVADRDCPGGASGPVGRVADRGVAGSDGAPPTPGDADGARPDADLGGADRAPGRPRREPAPSTAVTIAVATVGGDDDDDPELAAYNEALARLAEQDRRRAR